MSTTPTRSGRGSGLGACWAKLADASTSVVRATANGIRAERMQFLRSVVTSYDTTMRAIWREVPEDFLKQRHSWGADKKDEMWDGVLHLATRLSPAHQLFAGNLVLALVPIAKAKGLKAVLGVAIFRPEAGDQDYRIPDLVVFKPSQFSERGVEGACELAVEVLSPADETYDKLDFYARVGVHELWVLDPESCVPEI